MSFSIIIPARLASTRLPNKVLLDINGKPMLQYVYERALQSGAAQVVIATDSDEVKHAAEKFGAQVCMTAVEHRSGTERLAEAIKILNYSDDQIIVNVQGDEPLISPKLIAQTAADLAAHPEAAAATLCERITNAADINNPNVVKVVCDAKNFALYFSRAPIAWDRDGASADTQYYRHIGLYAYRVRTIQQYINWPICYLERMECLEQLRLLWNGSKIYVTQIEAAYSLGIDTIEDLKKLKNYLKDK